VTFNPLNKSIATLIRNLLMWKLRVISVSDDYSWTGVFKKLRVFTVHFSALITHLVKGDL
jgi:hypothetical protein